MAQTTHELRATVAELRSQIAEIRNHPRPSILPSGSIWQMSALIALVITALFSAGMNYNTIRNNQDQLKEIAAKHHDVRERLISLETSHRELLRRFDKLDDSDERADPKGRIYDQERWHNFREQ